MTSREALALAVVAAPVLSAGAVAVARRRAVPASPSPAGSPVEQPRSPSRWSRSPRRRDRLVGTWVVVDAAGGLLVGVIGLVGLASVLVSPAYLRGVTPRSCAPERRPRTYYAILFAFWAVLVAVPLAGNLGAAWLLVEATTAASALLVGFSGRPRALEAGWKYLILTSLGLSVALLGIVLIGAGTPGGGLDSLSWTALGRYDGGSETALVAYLLLLAGLAAKVGWAPVHNWLPDAHAEAPAPVSALLSAALLPAVLLVAWRCEQALAPVVGSRPPSRCSSASASSRSPSPCRSSGSRSPGSGCSPTRASSTWG